MLFYLFSLGCKVNSYENDALREELLARGDQEVFSPEKADLVVLNTCAVTAVAEQKSRQHARKFRRLAPNAIIVVMGCYGALHAKELLAMGADIAIGTSNRDRLLSLIDAFKFDHKKIALAEPPRSEIRYENLGAFSAADNARAYLKIQDGCDNFCSYCLIPYLRGPSRSRKREDVLLEAKRLVEKGYKEIIVTGIHIGFYGKDLGDGSYRLSDLIKDLLDDNPTLYRLRISSLEESEIDDKFLALLRNEPRIADHLHLPLQSGSEGVLKRMHRKYDIASFKEKVREIRLIRPRIALTTDLIAGFSGETSEEWDETMKNVRELAFCEVHVFPYSPREGTLSYRWPDTDPETKKSRVRAMLALSKELREEYERGFYGEKLEVLFESYDEKTHLAYGHTSNYLLVKKESPKSLHDEVEAVEYSPTSRAD